MSRLSGRLRSGGVRLACGGLADEDCSEASEGPSAWGVGDGSAAPGSGPAPAASLHYSFYSPPSLASPRSLASPSPPSLANGLRNHDDQLQRSRARRRRPAEHSDQHTHTHVQAPAHQHTPHMHDAQTHSHATPQMDTHLLTDTLTHAQMDTHTHMDTHGQMDAESAMPEQHCSDTPEDLSSKPRKQPETHIHTPLIQLPPPHTHIHPSPNTAATQHTDPMLDIDPAHPVTDPAPPVPITMEAERKYTLRSSGRPRFPCRLRKSSRLRRATEEVVEVKREDTGREEEETSWRGGEETRGRREEERPLGVESAALPVGPLCPSSVLDRVLAGVARGRRKGRFLGVRRIVVKVARIPVHLSRRQKSYKISSLETPASEGRKGGEGRGDGATRAGGGEGIVGGIAPHREPTALLRMKNNGKSVMVMFPPGEPPVILKRRRGRPPKQAPPLPGQPDLRETRVGAANAAEGPPKKPRRRRRVKLPSPQPSYVNDTNDVKQEYGDVLSKLAFLNRQPPATGRCSPPRCWTPTDPESFHAAPERNPSLSALLHRLTAFRRRGGRAGCMGGRGGGGGGAGGCSSEAFKSSFSDFFETIGKKRKVPPAEPGAPRKRGKGAGGGGMSRAAQGELGAASTSPGEKPVRKRRSRKNGALKVSGQGGLETDWPNGSSGWGGKGGADTPDRDRAGVYQGSASPRGNFPSCELGKGGLYGSPGVRGSGAGGVGGEEVQGLFAGYFRSLLDSDDSSDLLDISLVSSPAGNSRKLGPGYESAGSPASAQQRWSPAFPKRSPKGAAAPVGEGGPPQPQSNSTASARPPYSYGLSQTSPPTPSFPKSPGLSLSRSPSSPHPSSGGFSQYPSGYSGGAPAGASSAPHPQQQQHRPSDCSYAYGAKAPSASPAAQCQMGYSSYQASVKRGYGSYPGAAHSAMLRGEPSAGPVSPGGGYMAMAKSSPFSSSSSSPPEGCRQYPPTTQWGYRQGVVGHGWGGIDGGGFGSHQFHGYSDYSYATGASAAESKDILDISNYTPQKAKQRTCSDTLSESSSDSSHLGGAGGLGGSGGGGGVGGFRLREAIGGVVQAEGQQQSSLSSLEKLMLDWHESSAGPSYNWSQSVLFQGGGAKPGRGRRKRAETQGGEACPGVTPLPPGSPSSSPPAQGGGGAAPKRTGVGGRQPRGPRSSRGGYSPCQRERPKPKPQKASSAGGAGQMGGAGGVYQEALDYYSGDSSSLSPLSHAPETCEYPSPYSAHPSTPSSDERFAQIFPCDSASLSPSLSLQPDVLKPYPKPQAPPPQPSYCPASRTFSPALSPTPRLLPQCGSALSPHRTPKDQFPQYDSPSYSGSPCWFGQGGGISGSPHGYDEPRPPTSALPPPKSDLSLMGSGLRVPPPSPYPSPLHRGPALSSSCVGGALDSSPQPEDLGYGPTHMDSFAPLTQRYAPPMPVVPAAVPRGGVLCQLLDQPSEDGFTVTSL